MMECPRCGFSQPKDRYCASCGLDIEKYLKKPKPVWVRVAQNPNVHLTLIGVLIVLVVGYIFYSQSRLIQKQVNALLKSTPLSSRDAEVKSQKQDLPPPPPPPPAPTRAAPVEKPTEAAVSPAAEKQNENLKFEISYWEIPREDLNALLSVAEKVSEGQAGRAYLWPTSGNKIAEAVQNKGRRISSVRTLPQQGGSQVNIETPPTAAEAFQFGLYFQSSKDGGIKWDSTLVLPQAEAGEALGSAPAMRSLNETTLSGTAVVTNAGLLMLVYEPSNRIPRPEYISRAGEGPWTIFTSDAFRAGATDWVVLVQLK